MKFPFFNLSGIKHTYSWLSRRCTARGTSSRFSLVGPTSELWSFGWVKSMVPGVLSMISVQVKVMVVYSNRGCLLFQEWVSDPFPWRFILNCIENEMIS